MTQLICNNKSCKKVIIENLEDYRKKYPDEKYVQCPYCGAQGTF